MKTKMRVCAPEANLFFPVQAKETQVKVIYVAFRVILEKNLTIEKPTIEISIWSKNGKLIV